VLRALLGNPRLANRIYGFVPPERGTVLLRHRRVYILPTRLGLLYAGALAILLVGSINYALALGFALTFLLAGIGLAAMVHTARNLARLSVSVGRAPPVHAGGRAAFRVLLESRARYDRPAILIRHRASGAQALADVPPAGNREVTLEVAAPRRGWLPFGRAVLETRFPLGLFRAWSHIEPEVRTLVYPRPEYAPLPAARTGEPAGAPHPSRRGADDYAGLRDYHPADSPRQVAWKTAARTGQMMTKLFAGESGSELWLDWDEAAPAGDAEARLSRLAGWVLQAERQGLAYGLRLPGTEIAPGRGEAQRERCLEALALYPAPR